jgi:hypothetical protein
MEWIYLETEDMKAVERFRNEFKEKLIITESRRIKDYKAEMGLVPSITLSQRKFDNYTKGLEYIIDTVLLSCCDSLIAPKVNGSQFALSLNNNNYKNKYIYSLGKYE